MSIIGCLARLKGYFLRDFSVDNEVLLAIVPGLKLVYLDDE